MVSTAGGLSGKSTRHCERSEAIQRGAELDCFVVSLLAMTCSGRPQLL
jgi:hypothetical protein